MAERVQRGRQPAEEKRAPIQSERSPGRLDVDGDVTRLSEGLSIDQFALDEALVRNGQVFHDVADACALALSRRDAAADELKQTEAEVDQIIRKEATKEGVKYSEDAIKRMIVLHADVISARQRMRNREEELNRFTALKESYSQRSYAIKDLVSLHLAAYFGTTGKTVRRDVDEQGGEARRSQIRKDQTDHRLRNRNER